jgi:hypothetical protein
MKRASKSWKYRQKRTHIIPASRHHRTRRSTEKNENPKKAIDPKSARKATKRISNRCLTPLTRIGQRPSAALVGIRTSTRSRCKFSTPISTLKGPKSKWKYPIPEQSGVRKVGPGLGGHPGQGWEWPLSKMGPSPDLSCSFDPQGGRVGRKEESQFTPFRADHRSLVEAIDPFCQRTTRPAAMVGFLCPLSFCDVPVRTR